MWSCLPLYIIASSAEDHERVSSQIIQNANQVSILVTKRRQILLKFASEQPPGSSLNARESPREILGIQ